MTCDRWVICLLLPLLAVGGSDLSARPSEPTHVQLMMVTPAGVSVPGQLGDQLRSMERSANAWLVRQTGKRVRVRHDSRGDARIPTVRLDQSEAFLAGKGEALMAFLVESLDVRFPENDDIVVFAYLGRVELRSRSHCGRRIGRFSGLFLANGDCLRHLFASGDGQGWDKIFLHELFHALGAVQACAPNGDDGRHVDDSVSDLMHRNGGGRVPQIDSGRDDYFGHGREDCVDVARSALVH